MRRLLPPRLTPILPPRRPSPIVQGLRRGSSLMGRAREGVIKVKRRMREKVRRRVEVVMREKVRRWRHGVLS